MELIRIRWKETWGDQLGGVVEDAFTPDEAEGLLPALAADWFPGGHELEQDPDSPNAWVATDRQGRRVWSFREPQQGITG